MPTCNPTEITTVQFTRGRRCRNICSRTWLNNFCHHHAALVLPPLLCYPPHSCPHSVASDLAAVVAAALPPPCPLLPYLPPPLLPRNPRPCCRCQRRNTPLSLPHRPRSSCRCRLPCPPLPLPSCPCLPSPSHHHPLALAIAP
jgi:hypothetical protein